MLQTLLVIFSSAANFLGALIYAKDTYQGKAKPNRVSFFLWALTTFIGTAAAIYDNGWHWAVLPVFTAGLCSFTIFLISFFAKGSPWILRPSDFVCGILSLLALVLWKITEQPAVAILFAILSDFLATAPTLKKSWTNPETETPFPYILGSFCPATSFLVAKTWSFSEIAFPAYLFVASLSIALTIYYRRSVQVRHPPA